MSKSTDKKINIKPRPFSQRRPPLRSLLSKEAILFHHQRGDIIIEPFDPRCLKTTSCDVRLGKHFYREQRNATPGVFNPFDKNHVTRHWGDPQQATLAEKWMEENGVTLKNIPKDAYIIVLRPGETVLGHTIEFIGGRNVVTTEMRARSSAGRIGITVCKCAGWGDLGYINRWTMEITNHLTDASVVLVVGMRIAQIAFMKVDPVTAISYATDGGKYQLTDDLEAMKAAWHPSAMLPKLYQDYELTDGFPPDLVDLKPTN